MGRIPSLIVGIAVSLGICAAQSPAQQAAAPQPATPRVFAAEIVASGFIGMVVDSIHGGPLAGAKVDVAGTARYAISDGRGRFRIDSVPPGDYRLEISHPLFDTLGLSLTTQKISVTPHHFVVVALGTPSARTLRHERCPSADTMSTPSFITGRLRDADTGLPAAGANVSFAYSALAVALASGVHHDVRVRRAVADADGMYAICGLESDLVGSVQAEHAGVATAEVETALNGSVIALRSLSTGSSASNESPNSGGAARDSAQPAERQIRSATSSNDQLQHGTASLSGRVLDPAGAPVVGAIVAVSSTAATTRTGSRGEFSLRELPSGTQEVAVRNLGFDPAAVPVELTSRTPQSVTVTLHRAAPSLPPVVVTSKTDAGLARLGFFDRQKASAGFFITPEEVAQAQPRVVTDLIFLVPGWQVQTNSSGLTVLLPPRSAYAEGASSCMNVYIDHALMTRLSPGEFDSAIPARDVVAVEVYSRSTVPAEFARAGESCVTIVVWTRARVEK
jgi:hypothetical protein